MVKNCCPSSVGAPLVQATYACCKTGGVAKQASPKTNYSDYYDDGPDNSLADKQYNYNYGYTQL